MINQAAKALPRCSDSQESDNQALLLFANVLSTSYMTDQLAPACLRAY